MELISHQDRTLKEHLAGLIQIIEIILGEKQQHFLEFSKLKEIVLILVTYHDLAKSSIYFQLYLAYSLLEKNENHKYYSKEELGTFIDEHKEAHIKWKNNPSLKNHSLTGAWSSLFFWDKEKISYSYQAFIILMVLKAHHGYLKNFEVSEINPSFEMEDLVEISKQLNYSDFEQLANELKLPFQNGDFKSLINNFKVSRFDRKLVERLPENDGENYFKTLFLFSLLVSADKGDLMIEGNTFDRPILKSTFVNNFKQTTLGKKQTAINKLREEAYQLAVDRVNEHGQNNFFSITLPTGLGKTLTAYKVALRIKEQFNPSFRIVYCLPFTSIIDQNGGLFKDIFDLAGINRNVLGIHHHLSKPKYTNEDNIYYSEWEYFAKGWQNEVTVTTFVQIWESIFACHNRQIRKFHNLANSIIIFDEVQAISPKLYPAFEFALESLAKWFGTKFVFVTATQPILLKEKVTELCLNDDSAEYFFSQLDRTVLDTSETDTEITAEELANRVINFFYEQEKSILVICNTIRFSQKVMSNLVDKLDKESLFYLSASIIPFSRNQVLENQIKPKLSNGKPIVLISTQVVEAGVDIDFDVVFRDFAPLPSINQAAGRCNRNSSKGVSEVFIFNSGKNQIYDPTQLGITSTVLKNFTEQIPESLFFDLNNAYYEEVKTKIQDRSNVSNELIKDISKLRFEDVGRKDGYRLIRQDYITYNFFIEVDSSATKIWNQYLDLKKVDDFLEKKKQLQFLRPDLMKYVVKIPDYVLQPNPDERDKVIINRNDWESFYDIKLGYKITKVSENHAEVF